VDGADKLHCTTCQQPTRWQVKVPTIQLTNKVQIWENKVVISIKLLPRIKANTLKFWRLINYSSLYYQYTKLTIVN